MRRFRWSSFQTKPRWYSAFAVSILFAFHCKRSSTVFVSSLAFILAGPPSRNLIPMSANALLNVNDFDEDRVEARFLNQGCNSASSKRGHAVGNADINSF